RFSILPKLRGATLTLVRASPDFAAGVIAIDVSGLSGPTAVDPSARFAWSTSGFADEITDPFVASLRPSRLSQADAVLATTHIKAKGETTREGALLGVRSEPPYRPRRFACCMRPG